jgi:hypothetical protein
MVRGSIATKQLEPIPRPNRFTSNKFHENFLMKQIVQKLPYFR